MIIIAQLAGGALSACNARQTHTLAEDEQIDASFFAVKYGGWTLSF
jgi:hypothetical protein